MANFGAKLVAWPTDQNDLAPQVRVMVIWAIPKYKCFFRDSSYLKGGCEGKPEKFCPGNTEKVSETLTIARPVKGRRLERCQDVWCVHLRNLPNLRIPGAELQNGGRGKHAEKAGCEKQGGPLGS